jgi:telomerase protein component 1
MEEEREHLERIVFPELRHRCEKHGVSLLSVDLGWGAGHYGGTPNEALSMCLANVSKCSYFLGVLGEQYGTEFRSPDESLLRQCPWLAQRPDRSFVEYECVHGALGDTPAARHAFFYLRASTARKAHLADGSAASDDEASGTLKLKALKREVHGSAALVRDYDDIEILAEMVLRDLAAALTEDYPR